MFSPEIKVSFGKDLVRFAKKHEVLELKPEVYLDNNQPPRVLSVGAPPIDAIASRVVLLFDGKVYEEDKVLILEAFFRFGLRKLVGGGFGFSPRVVLEIAPEIVAQLGGYHSIIFHYCAKMAGANSTSYETNTGSLTNRGRQPYPRRQVVE